METMRAWHFVEDQKAHFDGTLSTPLSITVGVSWRWATNLLKEILDGVFFSSLVLGLVLVLVLVLVAVVAVLVVELLLNKQSSKVLGSGNFEG